MSSKREVQEGVQEQSTSESIGYSVTVTNWGSSPTSVSCKVYDESDEGKDVTTTVMPTNSPTVNSNVIQLSALTLLTKGHTYRVEVKFTVSSNVMECFFRVKCDM